MTRDIEHDVFGQFIAKLRRDEDELGLIIKGHLFVEVVVNQIVSKRCKNPKVILSDHRTYSFAVKLQMLYQMGLIPDHIYQNIQKVNKIRNQFAHNLEVNSAKIDFTVFDDNGKTLNLEPVIKGKRRLYPQREYIKTLCILTITQLNDCFQNHFGEPPKYDLRKD